MMTAAQAVPEIVDRRARCGRFRADHRRLPLQRPSAAYEVSRDAHARSQNTGSIPATSAASDRDENFRTIVEVALDNDKPVRIGVNWGSLDQDLLTQMMDENARAPTPRDAKEVYIEAMVESALRSAALAEEAGLGHDRIIISGKVSVVQDLVDVYRRLAERCDFPLHLGLTEAGLGTKGIVASTAALPFCWRKALATRFECR